MVVSGCAAGAVGYRRDGFAGAAGPAAAVCRPRRAPPGRRFLPYVGWPTLTLLAVLAALAWLADFIAGAYGAKRFGASNRAMVGAAIGALVGLFFGIPGLLLGPFLGAVAGELTARADLQAASRAGIGAFLGLVLGTAAKMALGFAMVGIFLAVRLF
ncbi:MAG: DUF456 domain-containing protein [Syntrophotaleaceae bacterium]